MKKFLLLSLFFTTMFLISCKNDQKVASEEITEESVEEIAEDFLEQELAEVEVSEDETLQEGAVANEVEVELEEVKIDEEKVKEQKKAILKEQLKESPNLGKDCESILKEYGELVDQYVRKDNQEAVLKRLAEWANDPIYNKCKKDPAYRDRFYELEDKMYADEEDF